MPQRTRSPLGLGDGSTAPSTSVHPPGGTRNNHDTATGTSPRRSARFAPASPPVASTSRVQPVHAHATSDVQRILRPASARRLSARRRLWVSVSASVSVWVFGFRPRMTRTQRRRGRGKPRRRRRGRRKGRREEVVVVGGSARAPTCTRTGCASDCGCGVRLRWVSFLPSSFFPFVFFGGLGRRTDRGEVHAPNACSFTHSSQCGYAPLRWCRALGCAAYHFPSCRRLCGRLRLTRLGGR
ncbi:hypothetical protein B0H13DRAFT_1018980 [Mycena leptocephala]|nr:hypothetical protein B0H13DRAFT_1018980 [Mycena leptocephala]